MKLKICLAAMVFVACGIHADPYTYTAPTYTVPTYTVPTYTAPTYTAPSYTYDATTGNSYSTTPTYGGGANVMGTNTNTGSMWNTNIQADGDMSGIDSQGNYWTYDKQTGNYMNTNGKLCTGTGATRICND
ncbi:hypothetical protein [Rheinheimera tilapiae]|uniref:YHYH domain-containing protein n=1 Tax=Rheinheimera tilapiae TaxID=875043 RepID=A0ABV6BA66_9GAMM